MLIHFVVGLVLLWLAWKILHRNIAKQPKQHQDLEHHRIADEAAMGIYVRNEIYRDYIYELLVANGLEQQQINQLLDRLDNIAAHNRAQKFSSKQSR